ncbi:MAG: RDD family protein [Acidimicrobiia bacterium]
MTERSRARALQGTRAGFVSRVVAASVDVLIVFVALLACEGLFAAARFIIGDSPFEFPDLGATANSSLLVVLLIVVLTIAWSGSGRTLGNTLVGLRVVREDGSTVTWLRSAVRAVVVLAFHVVAMGWILVSKKNAGLHDLVCRTTVVYDWHPRQAGEPSAGARSRHDR